MKQFGNPTYSEAVLDHFKNPRNVGDLPNATAMVEVSNPACGDIMQLAVRIEDECIVEVRFKVRGCVAAIACGSLLTTWLDGTPLDELGPYTPHLIADALGGLPLASNHGSQLACDAYDALMKKLFPVSSEDLAKRRGRIG